MKSSIKIELANRKLGTNLALTFGQLENYDCGKGQYVAYNYLAWRLERTQKSCQKYCLVISRAFLAAGRTWRKFQLTNKSDNYKNEGESMTKSER